MSTLVPLSLSSASPFASFGDAHPLEPLSAAEVARTVAVLKGAGKVSPTTRFVSISLHEPPKELVHAATLPPPPREAFVVLFDNAQNACYEAVVALATERLLD